MKVMQVQFWSDALDTTSSVGKVIDGFSYSKDPDLELVIASLGESSLDTQKNGKRFIHFQESAWRNKIFNKMLGLKAFTYPALLEMIERERPEILHFHNRSSLIDAIAKKLSYKPRILIHCHRKFKEFYIPQTECEFIAVSQAIKDYLIDIGVKKNKVHVVYNPIPMMKYLPSRQAFSSIFERKIKILYAGGGEIHKGYREIMDVWSKDHSLLSKFELHICGPKIPQDSLKKDGIIYYGYLDHQRFSKLLLDCDVVIMPSYHEGLPMMALEAMSAYKVLISTRGGGLAELVSEDNCLKLDIQSSASILASLENLLKMSEVDFYTYLDDQITRLQPFSIEDVNKTLCKIYRSS